MICSHSCVDKKKQSTTKTLPHYTCFKCVAAVAVFLVFSSDDDDASHALMNAKASLNDEVRMATEAHIVIAQL